jgi:MFS family permease
LPHSLALDASPARPRRAGIIQGWILVSCAWVSVIASATLSPVLPRMTVAFQGQPHVNLLISLTATLPALFVALLAWPMGMLGDRIGHKRVLFWSTVVYGLFGTAPAWLSTLPQIVGSRALVGISEAAVMTCSAALVGAMFGVDKRPRYFALQTGTAPLVSLTVIALGGVLGEASWRYPFLVYGFGFVLIPLTGLLLWDPPQVGRGSPRELTHQPAEDDSKPVWRKLFWISAITVFAMTAFLVTIIQLSFLLTERGITSPRLIGLWSSMAALANPLGATTFALLRWRPESKVTLCFLLLSVGFFVMSLLPGWQPAIVGAMIANFGAGMILPTLITWAISTLPARYCGTGTGVWMAASFLGQFLSPLVILWLRSMSGSLSNAILIYAVTCALCGVAGFAFKLSRPSNVDRSDANRPH